MFSDIDLGTLSDPHELPVYSQFVRDEFKFLRELHDGGYVHNQMHNGNKGLVVKKNGELGLGVRDFDSLQYVVGVEEGQGNLSRMQDLFVALLSDVEATLVAQYPTENGGLTYNLSEIVNDKTRIRPFSTYLTQVISPAMEGYGQSEGNIDSDEIQSELFNFVDKAIKYIDNSQDLIVFIVDAASRAIVNGQDLSLNINEFREFMDKKTNM